MPQVGHTWGCEIFCEAPVRPHPPPCPGKIKEHMSAEDFHRCGFPSLVLVNGAPEAALLSRWRRGLICCTLWFMLDDRTTVDSGSYEASVRRW